MTEILIISRSDLRQLMTFSDYVDVVADAFQLLTQGRCHSPVPTEIREERGTFHIKPGSLPRGAGYVAVKINGNFPSNRASCGLPTIQGAVYLADASNGRPLALLDSMEITVQRTGAATAIAARYLARPDAATAAICGCGDQAAIQLAALRHVLHLRRVFAWDVDRQAARDFAARIVEQTGLAVQDVDDLGEATYDSDAIVTCTSAREAFLGREHVRPGTFIAAVGADNPAKSEIKPELMAKAAVYVDVLEQACVMGDLHHAITARAMRADQVQGNLGQLVSGEIHGRQNNNEIIIFDSTGTGIQDVAAAARAYELAGDRGIGLVCTLA